MESSSGPRLYDTIEPNVIDEDTLKKAIEEQGPKNEAGIIAKAEGINYKNVTSLRLDFRNILQIDNLWFFDNLTKLQLDNNIIEKIEGLSTLVNLVWLDLSFNNIEVIENLEELTKLKDLTLFNNCISTIENVGHLLQLEVLSLGNNKISDLKSVIDLRVLKDLKTLNLSGNPVCDPEVEYKLYVIAHLPNLVYLDYRMIDEDVRETAKDTHYVSVEELAHDERVAKRKLDEKLAKEAEFSRHKEAYVENLNGPQLFEGMYQGDTEGVLLNEMPGAEEIVVAYREKFASICQQVFDLGLHESVSRKQEIDGFFDCLDDAKRENNTKGQDLIDAFNKSKKEVFAELLEIQDADVLDAKVQEYSDEISKLWDSLMGLEMQLVDQVEDANKDFERNLSELVSNFVESVQGLTAQLRDLENQHNERMTELAIITLEKVIKNEITDEISDECRELFVDKDTIMNGVNASHDYHLLKIDNREDELVQRLNTWQKSLISDLHQREEIERNRKRVLEISHLIDHLGDELDSMDFGMPEYEEKQLF